MKKIILVLLSVIILSTTLGTLSVGAVEAVEISMDKKTRFEFEDYTSENIVNCTQASGGRIVSVSDSDTGSNISIPIVIPESGYYVIKYVVGKKTATNHSKVFLSIDITDTPIRLQYATNQTTSGQELSYVTSSSQEMALYTRDAIWLDKNTCKLTANVEKASGKYTYQLDYVEIYPKPVPEISSVKTTRIELDAYGGEGVMRADYGLKEDSKASGGYCLWNPWRAADTTLKFSVTVNKSGYYDIFAVLGPKKNVSWYSLITLYIGNQELINNKGFGIESLGYGWDGMPAATFENKGVFLKAGTQEFRIVMPRTTDAGLASKYNLDYIEFTPGEKPADTGNTHTVKFNSNGAGLIPAQTVEDGSVATEPRIPYKKGDTFVGWYTDSAFRSAYDFSSPVTQDLALYARWSSSVVPVEPEPVEPEPVEPEPVEPEPVEPEPVEPEPVDPEPSDGSWKNPFTDVKENDWFYNSIKYANENSLMNGVSDSLFGPNSDVTRAMFVTVLYRIENQPDVISSSIFEDVESGSYYEKAVAWAHANKIVNGVSDTAFAPHQNISREQMAAMMYRYAQYKNMDVSASESTDISSYDDFDAISDYAVSAIKWACGSKIMSGETETTFNPKNLSTRAQAATVFMRVIENNK